MSTEDIDLEKMMTDPEYKKRVTLAHGGTPPGFPSDAEPPEAEDEPEGEDA